MPQDSMWVRRRSLWPCPRTAIQSQSGASPHSPSIWKDWRIGFSSTISELFQILEKHKIDVQLVNARHVKNVPGRKTDVEDCQWIQHLHSVGLLRGSFRPDDEICSIRSLWRHRENLIQLATVHLQHMQKTLDQMTLQIHHVISDLSGPTGVPLSDAILSGERDPKTLAKLRDWRIKASEETIMKSLVGDYREEHLFVLRQSLVGYRSYQKM